MLPINKVIKTIKLNSLTALLLIMMAHLLLSPLTIANEIENEAMPFYSISHGALKSELNAEHRKKIIEDNKRSLAPDQLNNKATSYTRKIMIKNSKTMLKKYDENLVTHNHDYYADFAIYEATSFLLDDFDYDGFYQTFSIAFDADVYSYTEDQLDEVYALLYISKNGGPWTHYFTTDNFIINGESDLDEYEIITTFLSGYSADYYDVLIDLYQAGYSDVVASYSSNDSNALYALSLESADYDEPYVEVIEVSHGGSFSIITLLTILVTSAFRFPTQNKTF